MTNIGKPKKEIEVEPISTPEKAPTDPITVPKPEKVPA